MNIRHFDFCNAASHTITWDKLEYMVFDCPGPSERYNSYATRYLQLLAIVPKGKLYHILSISRHTNNLYYFAVHPFVKIAPYEYCTSRDDVESVSIMQITVHL